MAPQYESEKVENFGEQNWLKGLQIVQFEFTRVTNPCIAFTFGVFIFAANPVWPGRLFFDRAIAPRIADERSSQYHKWIIMSPGKIGIIFYNKISF